ncbi:hypothetical protein BaRGS_00027167 [Batillaria attramentaria]|uniref:Uncharacterized protein n=1 Tax=Batillaria attramentaria TaxID=370345 RepID=A0ABD0K476_9CAEN
MATGRVKLGAAPCRLPDAKTRHASDLTHPDQILPCTRVGLPAGCAPEPRSRSPPKAACTANYTVECHFAKIIVKYKRDASELARVNKQKKERKKRRRSN